MTTATTHPGLVLDGIAPGETTQLDAVTLDRTAAACAWLIPLAELSTMHLGTHPAIAAWLRKVLRASEDSLAEHLQ